MVSSLALYDRLKKEVPDFVEGCASKGLVYQIPHTAKQVGGIVGGNGLYKASAFRPTDGSAPADTEEERRIIELAERGGWHAGIDKSDESIPAWQRRGFSWNWQDNGDLEVTHRVPGRFPTLCYFVQLFVDERIITSCPAGVRLHPTQHIPAIFNVSSTYL